MDSCPKELRPYEIAHKKKIMEMDNLMWTWFGNYATSAVSVAVEHNLAGRKAKSKYIDKPILQYLEEQSRPLTEEELQKQRELFVAKLMVMKTNFDLNKSKNNR